MLMIEIVLIDRILMNMTFVLMNMNVRILC